MLERISQSVYRWIEMHGETRGEPYTWNSYAIDCPNHDVLALIDPLALTDEDAAEIEAIRKPTHILLSCEYHLRDAETLRNRWGCRLLANTREQHWYDVDLDGTFEEGQRLWGKIDLMYVPDVIFQETAFLVEEEGVLIVGDLIAGGRQDQGIEDEDLALGGPLYVSDLGKARQSVRKLLTWKFETLCFAHGTPVKHQPYRKLGDYLENDSVWDEMAQRKLAHPLTEEERSEIALLNRLNALTS